MLLYCLILALTNLRSVELRKCIEESERREGSLHLLSLETTHSDASSCNITGDALVSAAEEQAKVTPSCHYSRNCELTLPLWWFDAG